jgi:minor pilin subunit PapK
MKAITGWRLIQPLTLLVMFGCSITVQAEMDIKFKGTLQVKACSLKKTTVDVTLPDFSVKEFYERIRTPATPFTLELDECDSVIGKNINVLYSGPKEAALPGMLAVAGDNLGALGIGIVDLDGSTLLPLDQKSQQTAISSEALKLTFGAFVEATPEAIANKNILPGAYSAQASFTFEYE